MPPSPRANARQTDMPCSDLEGAETDTTMLTTLFDPTEWPPLLNLMDNTNVLSSEVEVVGEEKAQMKRKKRDFEPETENAIQKRSKLETVGNADSCEDEMHPIEESPDQRERRHQEERRNVLRISVCKMRTIEDPEIFLRRSVLIHNTIRRLQVDMGQENFVKFTQNFVSEENNVENDRTRCLVGILEHQGRDGRKDHQETSAKEYRSDLNDYSEYNDNSDEESDDDDEEDDDDDDLCVSKDFQDDRLGTKEMNPSTCICYQDTWCRHDCVRGCSARREGNHCATEYRTTRNTNCQGESVFDSVVYQSLLVSLES